MKWRTKKSKFGNERIREKFLWLPKSIDNEVRWLEKAKFKEVYKRQDIGYGWVGIAWLEPTVKDKLKKFLK